MNTNSVLSDGSERKFPLVLQILPSLNGGGVERGTIEVAKALKSNGYESIVCSSGGFLTKDLQRIKVEHITLPVSTKNPFKIWQNSKILAKIIREKGIDIIHARSRAPAWSAYFAAKKTGIKFLTTFHGTYSMGPCKLKKLYNSIMTKGDLVIAVSDYIANLIKKDYQLSEQKIRVVHRGVDTDIFDATKVSKTRIISLSKKWNLPDGATIIMLPCRLSRWKGHHLMLEALSRLKEREDLYCIFVGSIQGKDSFRKEIEHYASSLGLGGKVRMISYCDDMPAAYMLADIVVSASTKPEAFGRTIVEAQAMGKIVIAADEGGACETIKNGLTGFLFKSKDSDSLADVLERVLDMSEREKEVLTQTAVNCAATDFSTRAMCAKTLKIYEELAKQ